MTKSYRAVLLLFTALPCSAQERFPAADWMQYTTPEVAGWSSEKLKAANAFADSIGSAAFMLVYDGAVVTTWGDVYTRFMCHSVRKSFLSALYGVHVGDGDIDVRQTLAVLNIDDKDDLSPAEKQASVLDLLKARSGVYHPAAYETAGMRRNRPARGSHAPGTFWFYNNWDFNTLLTIFEQETGTRIFEEFDGRIADPIQMEDFRIRDGYYHLEAQHSVHAAYPFRMSARDMARFGLLYARNGQWSGARLIPESWIWESRQSYSDAWGPDGYGYMWWINGGPLEQYGTYSARGVGTQAITVLPALDIVFVHRVNTFVGDRVSMLDVLKLLQLLLDARVAEAAANPTLVRLPEPTPQADANALTDAMVQRYTKTYTYPSGMAVEIISNGSELILEVPGFGAFGLQPISETAFLVEDAQFPVYIERSDNAEIELIAETLLNREGYIFLRRGDLAKAIEIFQQNVRYFPASFNVYDSLAEAYMANGDTELAIENYRRSLELNPNNTNAVEMLKKLER